MRSMRRAALGAGFFVTATVIAPPLSAQTYPDHPIKLIVPSASGGPTDIPARMTAGFIPKLGQPGVVEKPAGGRRRFGRTLGRIVASRRLYTAGRQHERVRRQSGGLSLGRVRSAAELRADRKVLRELP